MRDAYSFPSSSWTCIIAVGLCEVGADFVTPVVRLTAAEKRRMCLEDEEPEIDPRLEVAVWREARPACVAF